MATPYGIAILCLYRLKDYSLPAFVSSISKSDKTFM